MDVGKHHMGHLWRRWGGRLLVLLVVGVAVMASTLPVRAQAASSGSQPMYRLYNPWNGDHMFTLDVAERNNLTPLGWQYEGVAWQSPAEGDEVYRLYNPYSGEHLFTADKSEYDYLASIGWNKEGIGFRSDRSKGEAVYRLYNRWLTAGTHLYTTDKAEYDYLVSLGWSGEGVFFYGAKASSGADSTDDSELFYDPPDAAHIVSDSSTGETYVDNEVLITAKEGTPRSEVERIVAQYGGKVVGYIGVTNDYQIRLDTTKSLSDIESLVRTLGGNASLEEVTPNILAPVEFEMSAEGVPNDSEWASEEWSADYPDGKNWGVEAIDAMGAWKHLDQMRYVNVGVIDTCFDAEQEDLVYTKVWNNATKDLEGFSKNHGTHVSGTIAAGFDNGKGVAGVAPKVRLYGYSILGNDTGSVETDSSKTMVGNMDWKYSLARMAVANCKVVNVSMGYGSSYQDGTVDDTYLDDQASVLETFLDKLLNKGYDFVLVQSAGNEPQDAYNNGVFSRVSLEEVRDRVIIVGAVENNGSHKDGFLNLVGDRVFDGYTYADYSNFGDRVDVVAPGTKIYSTLPGNKYSDWYFYWGIQKISGTSMAAPHVSGVAAMCFSVNPKLTGAQVKSIVVQSARETSTVNRDGKSYPMLNANAAVTRALSTRGSAVSPVNPSYGIVMGNVNTLNANNGKVGLSGASITAYRSTTSAGNLDDYASSAQADSNGNYELVLEPGTYIISAYVSGYKPGYYYDVVVSNDQTKYLDDLTLERDSGTEEHASMHGTVSDALTGSGLEGVTLRLRKGWNRKSGPLASLYQSDSEAIATTGSDGSYSLDVATGVYTAECVKDGYVTGYANVTCSATQDASQDVVLTPVLADNEYRVVLTWSSAPRDLDSHLTGPLSDGGRFHVFYSSKTASDGDAGTVAELDLDDTSSYGPETITLKKTQDGIYRYSVHDYSNRNASSSTALSMSGAKVELYRGNALVETYHVPIDKGGTVWNVFEIHGDEVVSINTLEYQSSPSSVAQLDDGSSADDTLTAQSVDEDKDLELDKAA